MAVIILAGGQGKRMGAPKADVPFGDETLLTRACRLWSTILPKERIIVVGAGIVDFPVVSDLRAGLGPLGGLLTGLSFSEDEVNWVVGCDQPFVAPELPAMLARNMGTYDICLAEYEGYIQPFPGVYRRSIVPTLTTFLNRGLLRWRSFLARCHCMVLSEQTISTIDPNMWSFLNLNTRDDLERARQLEEKGGPLWV